MSTLGMLIFLWIFLIYVAICSYFWWRFFLHRRVQSMVCAVLPMGWPLLIARDLKLSPRWLTSTLEAIALTVGGLSLLVILVHELQKDRPFR